MLQLTTRKRRAGASAPAVLLAVAAAGTLAACDLTVIDPEFATPESLSDPQALPILIAGSIGDFAIAYSGGPGSGDSYLSQQGLITDELYSTDTFTTRTVVDQRILNPAVQGNSSDVAYNRFHAARRSLNAAADATARVASASDARIAELRSLQAYTYVGLGEGFCGHLPFSTIVDGEFVEGSPLTTAQTFDSAVAIFDRALAINSGYGLARIGKARALLARAQYEAAASAVGGVPTNYVYFIPHSSGSTRLYNPLFALQDNGRYGTSNDEGQPGNPWELNSEAGEGVPYVDRFKAGDPRVPVPESTVPGFDSQYLQWVQLRYTNFGSDVPLASGVEARLIEAEAALRRGDIPTWLARLNDLRANVGAHMARLFPDAPVSASASLPALTDPGNAAGRFALMFEERALWLYGTGHRLGDLRRRVRNDNVQQSSIFPSGSYFKGGTYGNDVAFPVPFDEEQNSLFDRDQCSTTQA